MTPSAEIRLLGYGRARPDLDFAKTVGVRSITQASAIVQRQIPRNGDARTLMHERSTVDLRIKDAKPKKAPLVDRLRRPRAKDEPANFPQRAHQAVTS